MLFILSFTLSVLTLAAGTFLLMKSKEGNCKFYRIMSWIIFAFGIFAIVASIHLAVMKCIMRHENGDKFMGKHHMFFDREDKDARFENCEKLCCPKKTCNMRRRR